MVLQIFLKSDKIYTYKYINAILENFFAIHVIEMPIFVCYNIYGRIKIVAKR